MRVHAFNGLFLLEARGTDAARDRLVNALAVLYHDLPDGRALLAPALLLQKYHATRGESDLALLWQRKAIAQCQPSDSIELLTQLFAPVARTDLTQVPLKPTGDVAIANAPTPSVGG